MNIVVLGLLMLLLTGCYGKSMEDCDPPKALQLRLGFYKLGESNTRVIIDTSFTSVYAAGTGAELRSRRIDNHYYLPVPVKGGQVSYILEQEDRQETLTLDYAVSGYIVDTECVPVLQIRAISVVPEQTTIPEKDILISTYSYPFYENTVLVLVH